MRLHLYPLVIAFREPFGSARGVQTEVRQHVVRLTWSGLDGHGAALGVDPAEFGACAEPLRDASPFELHRVLDRLQGLGTGPAVLAAVDMALHDLLGKALDRPLRDVLGLAGLPLPPTALSIPACSDAELVRRGERWADWPVLKVKLTAEDDARRVGLLRSVYPGRIRVDGNGSWGVDRALRIADGLARHDVELLEQPVAPGDLDALAAVHERSPVPVFADEDCAGPADIARLRGRVSGINVKLTKCGGLRAAGEMITLARVAGLQVMLGCKNESTLGVTAIAQLAPLADHLDLDAQFHLTGDPFAGIGIERGVLTLPSGPGLGVTADARTTPAPRPTARPTLIGG